MTCDGGDGTFWFGKRDHLSRLDRPSSYRGIRTFIHAYKFYVRFIISISYRCMGNFSVFMTCIFYDYIIVLLVHQTVISRVQCAQRSRDKHRIYSRSRCTFVTSARAPQAWCLSRVLYDFFVWYSVEFLVSLFVHQRTIISETVFGFSSLLKILSFTSFEMFLGHRRQSRRVLPWCGGRFSRNSKRAFSRVQNRLST